MTFRAEAPNTNLRSTRAQMSAIGRKLTLSEDRYLTVTRRKWTLAVVRYPVASPEFIWTRSNRQRMHGSHHRGRQSRRGRGRRGQYARQLPCRP
jgi:hypothetical protein